MSFFNINVNIAIIIIKLIDRSFEYKVYINYKYIGVYICL